MLGGAFVGLCLVPPIYSGSAEEQANQYAFNALFGAFGGAAACLISRAWRERE
jgi:hypothetical protein